MRVLLFIALGLVPAAAQNPVVGLVNLSHPFSGEFQVGDRYEVRIAGAPGQPISVRTVRQGRTDWSPVVDSTDSTGRWSISGQFGKSDFGSWSEIWTVGGRLATPAIHFDVNAPCVRGGRSQAFMSGPNIVLICDTPDGSQTFSTPSSADTFQTPDGRSISVGAVETPEQYHMEILTELISGGGSRTGIPLSSSQGGLGDETADLIGRLIGVNALNEKETQNVLAIIRGAFQKPNTIAPDAREPIRSLAFLRHLAELADQVSLRQQIDDTIAYVQAH